MRQSTFHPSFDLCESRSLCAVIFDIDQGILPGPLPDGMAAPSNVSTYPFDFTTGAAGPPEVTGGHGSYSAMEFVQSEWMANRHDLFIELKASGPDNLLTIDGVLAAEHWVATIGRQLFAGQSIVVTEPFAGPAPGGLVSLLPFTTSHAALARQGVMLSIAAGNDNVNVDVTTYAPVSSALAAPNVLGVAASQTGDGPAPGSLQAYSNYGTATVAVATRVDYVSGTSGAAIRGGIALASEMDANLLVFRKDGRPVNAVSYDRAIMVGVERGAVGNAALAGKVGTGGELLDLSRHVPIAGGSLRVGAATPRSGRVLSGHGDYFHVVHHPRYSR